MKKIFIIPLVFISLSLSAQDTLFVIDSVSGLDTTVCRNTEDGAGNFFAIDFEGTDMTGDTIEISHKVGSTYPKYTTEYLKTMDKTTPTRVINGDSLYYVAWRIDYTTREQCYKYYKNTGSTGPLILYQE